jgi:dihydrofolate reductase
MKIKLIAAHDKNLLIGDKNTLPWDLPEDLQHFKKTTSGKVIVMGKNTYLSIGKPLPKRINSVISTTMSLEQGINVFRDIKSLVTTYKNEEEIFIIGGTTIYNQFLPIADELIITQIESEFKGDSYFPKYEKLGFSIDMERSLWNLQSDNGLYYNIIYYIK